MSLLIIGGGVAVVVAATLLVVRNNKAKAAALETQINNAVEAAIAKVKSEAATVASDVKKV